MSNDKLMSFASSKDNNSQKKEENPWNILIVDDEQDVHDMTCLVLDGFTFQNKRVKLFHAKSAQEARVVLDKVADIALIILDVVMESDNAGLELVRHIREILQNEYVRIILRTGQPGLAPEQKVIVDYDINDYKGKADLTSQHLLTAIIAALRSFETIMTVAKLNNELEMKVEERTKELKKLNIDLESSLRQLEDDESSGRLLQLKMLPTEPEFLAPYSFHRLLIPSLHLSGDFVDYFRIDSCFTAFYLADVSGHGVASAFVTVLLKSFIRHYLDLYLSHSNNTILNPELLLKELNTELLKEDLGKHLTIFYGVLNSESNELIYVNGGHFPVPTVRSNNKVEKLAGKSPAIGLFDFSEYKAEKVEFPQGSQFLVFSDGILEILPFEKLADKCAYLLNLQSKAEISLEEIAETLSLTSAANFPDDITALTIKNG